MQTNNCHILLLEMCTGYREYFSTYQGTVIVIYNFLHCDFPVGKD